MKIVVPTCKSKDEIEPLIEEIRRYSPRVPIIATCTNGSAAENRNIGLSQCGLDETVIFVDDDVTGFFPGWDIMLVEPLICRTNVVMVAARLLRPDGRLAYMMGENYDVDQPFVEVTERRLPTACITFVCNGLTFDETFIGSGFEDTDFCKQLGNRYKNGLFVINNKVRLIHKNEQKNQNGENWKHNKAWFVKKWPEEYENEYRRK
jgi:glycosyltransferase involved in cell wall biosynthesis